MCKNILGNVTMAQAIDAMEAYGGSFASALAKAWRRADMDNARRLTAAFPELLEDYAKLAQINSDRAAKRDQRDARDAALSAARGEGQARA